MIVLAASIFAVAMVITAGLLASPSRDRLLRERLCDKVVVTMKSGSSFQGVLFKVDGQVVVLRDTQALGGGPAGGNVAVDGELFLFRSDVDFLQRP